VGTTARASRENVRSIGYSIYYTIVNIGGAAGPYVASQVHKHLSVENVFRVAALSVFLMFVAVLVFFREPRREGEAGAPGIGEVARNFLTVATNARFMLFLLIFTGYWIVFWQEFISLPLYIHAYIDPRADVELILVTDAATVIALQLLVSYLTKRIPAFHAVIIGTLMSGLAWFIVAFHPTLWGAVLTLIAVAVGEMIQAPRYYEYISRLAPAEQQGTYMGFAFLPIGIGSLVGGRVGGGLIHHYVEVLHQPEKVWWCIAGIGIATSLLLWIYDRVVRPGAEIPTPA
jgi:proton-dependent oligopeptide transporter, POT family